MSTENLAAPADGKFVGEDRPLKPEQVAEAPIDWNRAPAWAQYHAFDSDGVGGWHQSKPFINVRTPYFWSSPNWKWPSGYILPAGADWQKSLVERPKAEQGGGL